MVYINMKNINKLLKNNPFKHKAFNTPNFKSLTTPNFKSLLKNTSKGASPKLQNQWKNFSITKKNMLRTMFKDSDGDRVPNKYDCSPFNAMRQDAPQSLWHAGNQPPSETLKQEGRVYGFSSKQYADGWKEKHNKQNLYQFSTNKYVMDPQTYSRPLKGNRTALSDNEFVAGNVISETPYQEQEISRMKKQQDIYNEQELEHMKKANQYNNLDTYGRVSNYSGNKVGNAMIAADIVIPSAKIITIAGLGVKKYVDRVKVTHTDEADNEYTIPKVEFQSKSSKMDWDLKHRG